MIRIDKAGTKSCKVAVSSKHGFYDEAWFRTINTAQDSVIPWFGDHPAGYHVQSHQHDRNQFTHARGGTIKVTTKRYWWIIPPGHGIWIPAGIEHAVEMMTAVEMRSIYVVPNTGIRVPEGERGFQLSELMFRLMLEVMKLAPGHIEGSRDAFVRALIVDEIARMAEKSLNLSRPSDPRLVKLCRRMIEFPAALQRVNDAAEILEIGRRSFTRLFWNNMGQSFSSWRQQNCLLAAIPLLVCGETTARVASDLGYSSASAFAAMFRRKFGLSPYEFQQAARRFDYIS